MRNGPGGIRVGLSGWSYPHWRSDFYKGVPQRLWLQHCAAYFNTIEVNATFYRLLNPSVFARWRADTPEGFEFAIKGHRALTHARLLKDPGDRIAAQRDNSAELGDKLGAVLWQLPDRLHKNIDRLAGLPRILQHGLLRAMRSSSGIAAGSTRRRRRCSPNTGLGSASPMPAIGHDGTGSAPISSMSGCMARRAPTFRDTATTHLRAGPVVSRHGATSADPFTFTSTTMPRGTRLATHCV